MREKAPGKRFRARLLAAGLLPLICGSSAAAPNLVRNGGFESGRTRPKSWTRPDGLTVFWEKDGVAGKCLRLDTDVYRSEWRRNLDEPGTVSEKTPTSGEKYDTVAGSVGVAVYSQPIRVKRGAWYVIEYAVKGPAGSGPFLYVKGYREATEEDAAESGERIFFKPDPDGASFSLVAKGGVGEERRRTRPGDYIQRFRRRCVAHLPPGAEPEWCRYRGVVHLRSRYEVDVVLLELYAYWPPGTYWFDSVSMRLIDEREAKRITRNRTRHVPPWE